MYNCNLRRRGFKGIKLSITFLHFYCPVQTIPIIPELLRHYFSPPTMCYFKEHYIFSGGGPPSFAAQASLSEAADAILGHVEDHHRGANHPGGGEKFLQKISFKK